MKRCKQHLFCRKSRRCTLCGREWYAYVFRVWKIAAYRRTAKWCEEGHACVLDALAAL